MGIVYGFILVVLGLLLLRDTFGQKVPALKKLLDKLSSFSKVVGFLGLFLGLLWVLQAIGGLAYIAEEPFTALEELVAAPLLLVVSLIFALPLLHTFMNEPTPSFLLKLDAWAARIVPRHKYMGIAAIVLGIYNIAA